MRPPIRWEAHGYAEDPEAGRTTLAGFIKIHTHYVINYTFLTGALDFPRLEQHKVKSENLLLIFSPTYEAERIYRSTYVCYRNPSTSPQLMLKCL